MTSHPLDNGPTLVPPPDRPVAIPPALPPGAPAALLDITRIQVNLADLIFDPHNAQRHTQAAVEALAGNIREVGLLNEPLVCAAEEPGRYLVLAGEGRVRAMRDVLGWTSSWVRCLKGTLTESQRADLALIDNVVRNNSLNDPLLFGLACLDNMTRTGKSMRELAKVLANKSYSSISRAVALTQKLPPDVQDLVRRGPLTAEAALPLTALTDDEAKRGFAKLFVEGKIVSGADMRSAIKAARLGAKPSAQEEFHLEEGGVRLAVLFPDGTLAAVEPVLRSLLKDLHEHGKKGLPHFKELLAKKATARRKAAELEAAQSALAGLAKPPGEE
jgi:ParB/RepB/Spo0J family partition protein